MGQVTDYADDLASALSGVGRVTTNVRNAIPPCVLVVPLPRRNYDVLCGGYTATWTIVCLAPGPGDLTDAKLLEDMVDGVAAVVGITTAEPASYLLPSRESPAPAYLLAHTVTVTPDEEIAP